MAVITTILRSIRDQLARVPWLRQAVAQMVGPWVDTVNPLAGWPGTIVEISGAGFSSVLDNNVVQVGGASALVLEGSASRLLVLAGPATRSGPSDGNRIRDDCHSGVPQKCLELVTRKRALAWRNAKAPSDWACH